MAGAPDTITATVGITVLPLPAITDRTEGPALPLPTTLIPAPMPVADMPMDLAAAHPGVEPITPIPEPVPAAPGSIRRMDRPADLRDTIQALALLSGVDTEVASTVLQLACAPTGGPARSLGIPPGERGWRSKEEAATSMPARTATSTEGTVTATGVPIPVMVGSQSTGRKPEVLRQARTVNGSVRLRPAGPRWSSGDLIPPKSIAHAYSNRPATISFDPIRVIWIGKPRHDRAAT